MPELSSGHLSWTENFAASGKTEVLLWAKDDAFWWLGTLSPWKRSQVASRSRPNLHNRGDFYCAQQ
jgi:hypothetical protein